MANFERFQSWEEVEQHLNDNKMVHILGCHGIDWYWEVGIGGWKDSLGFSNTFVSRHEAIKTIHYFSDSELTRLGKGE